MKGIYKKHSMSRIDVSAMVMATEYLSDSTMVLRQRNDSKV